MQLTIEIPEDLFIAAARMAAQAELRRGEGYNSGTGAGYAEIARQTRNQLVTADYADLIRAEIARQIPDAIRASVEEAVSAHIKREMGRLRKSGELAQMVEEATHGS